MKLRYIKLLYPEVDEAVLFDLLYNCDHNAQTCIQRLEKMGYKRKEIVPRSKIKPAAEPIIARDTKPIRPKTVLNVMMLRKHGDKKLGK